MKECPSCALESAADESVCPYCGYEFPEQQRSMGWFAWLFAILLIWPLLEILKRVF